MRSAKVPRMQACKLLVGKGDELGLEVGQRFSLTFDLLGRS